MTFALSLYVNVILVVLSTLLHCGLRLVQDGRLQQSEDMMQSAGLLSGALMRLQVDR